MIDETAQARFVVHALFGPPRPVVVIAVQGEVDRLNEEEFQTCLRRATAVADTERGRRYFGARRVAGAVVVDLRAARFVSVSVVRMMVRARDAADGRLRLVVDPSSSVARYVGLLAAGIAVEVFDDLADAVLADTTTEHCD